MPRPSAAAAALCTACSPSPPAHPPCLGARRLLAPATWPARPAHARRYATPPPPDGGDQVPAWPRSPRPTPYEIFGIRPSSPYNKRRYYQLVKLYHPDTHGHGHGHAGAASPHPPSLARLSPAARLERYRLVVAANDLLSDPAKRRLYDMYGIGWTDGCRAPTLREADRAWHQRPGSAARNATWEDWERWRAAQNGHAPSEPIYMSNAMFAALVIIMCSVGAMVQASRAETSGTQFVKFSQERDAAIGRQIISDGMTAAGRSKDERVDSFLRERENTTYDYAPGTYDAPNRQPPPPPGQVPR